MISEVYNIDCQKFMVICKDKQFDLAIVDPPYGIKRDGYECGSKPSAAWKNPKKKIYVKKDWDNFAPTGEYFGELFRISKNQIIWGGNYFIEYLYSSMCIIAWNKEVNGNFSEFELAWTSFESRARLFKWMWNGYRKKQPEDRIHPTQKPVQLYKWLLKNYAKEGDTIFDSHMGSQSSRIACYDGGFDFWGCELDKDYFDDGNKRFENFKAQLKLF